VPRRTRKPNKSNRSEDGSGVVIVEQGEADTIDVGGAGIGRRRQLPDDGKSLAGAELFGKGEGVRTSAVSANLRHKEQKEDDGEESADEKESTCQKNPLKLVL